MNSFLHTPWYVLLISIYPALFYWSYNLTEMSYINGSKLVLISLLFGLIMLGVILLITRNIKTGSLVTFLALLLFWSYGHVYNYLHPLNLKFFDPIFLGVFWIILFIIGMWLIKARLSRQDNLPVALNLVTAFLVAFPAIEILPHAIQEIQLEKEKSNQVSQVPITGIGEPSYSYLPDIYYIILDTYAREDILREHFSFDNSDFIDQLEELGFYVADCSQSNYSQTHLSLSSSLNYRYLEEIVPPGEQFKTVVKKSSVQRILQNWGYKIVAFETGHTSIELTDADVYYSRTKGGLLTITEFDISFFETSLLQPFLRPPFYRADLFKAATHRSRSVYVLDRLIDTTEIQGPKFVYGHVMIPHPPFVFGPDGEAVYIDFANTDKKLSLDLYKDGFVKQTIFTNNRVLEIVKKILSESEPDPIIIIQGDHGPHIDKKIANTGILNAYYLPAGSSGLYETISPVNTFRYIFNTYFGQKLALYDDIALWSSEKRPLEFIVIPNQCNPEIGLSTKYLPVVFR